MSFGNTQKQVFKKSLKEDLFAIPYEGHGFVKFANQMMYLDQAERLLSQYLGGEYRPVDSSILSASSAQVSN